MLGEVSTLFKSYLGRLVVGRFFCNGSCSMLFRNDSTNPLLLVALTFLSWAPQGGSLPVSLVRPPGSTG